MANIQCSCGRAYSVPDDHLGKQVKCVACNRTFVAQAPAPPKAEPPKVAPPKPASPNAAAPPKPPPPKAPPRTPPPRRAATPKAPAARPVATPSRSRLGEMAVARGFLTRPQLSACLRYLEDIRRLPGQEELRLGSVLVTKRLLTKAQLDTLLKEQSGGAAAAAAATVDLTPRSAADSRPVTDEQREAVRRSVDAAIQKQAAREAAAEVKAANPRFVDRIRRIHVAIAGGIVLAALLVLMLWPEPPAKRVLEAYLRSSDEYAVAPDASLAITDLGLAVREFGDVTVLRSERYDYANELAAFAKTRDLADDWWELLGAVPMPDGKYEALSLLATALPEELTPTKIGSLQITVQPVACHMVSKQRGMGMFSEGRYRFVVLQARCPGWQCGWKVASYEPLSIATK